MGYILPSSAGQRAALKGKLHAHASAVLEGKMGDIHDELIAARIAYETAQIAYLNAKLRVLVAQQKRPPLAPQAVESDAPFIDKDRTMTSQGNADQKPESEREKPLHPFQAADCLEAAAKLVPAAWERGRHEGMMFDYKILDQAIALTEMAHAGLKHYKDLPRKRDSSL